MLLEFSVHVSFQPYHHSLCTATLKITFLGQGIPWMWRHALCRRERRHARWLTVICLVLISASVPLRVAHRLCVYRAAYLRKVSQLGKRSPPILSLVYKSSSFLSGLPVLVDTTVPVRFCRLLSLFQKSDFVVCSVRVLDDSLGKLRMLRWLSSGISQSNFSAFWHADICRDC